MSCVRYKFKSSLEYDKITFEGLQLSVGDLRKKIMSQKKLGLSDDFTLQIMDAQTKKIYSNDSEMVPRNTSVIIMRVPVASSQKLPKTQVRDNGLPKENGLVSDRLKKTGDLAGADASEEEKVLAMMSQAGEEYNPATYAKFKSRHGQGSFGSHLVKQPPPPNYVCHRCGLKGHWIKFCPTNGDPSFDNPRIKTPSGIPKSHMVPVSANTQGAMIDRQGNLVKRATDVLAGDQKSKSAEPIDTSVPPELTCNICKELIRDAVIIPCCGESFCDECIREYLLENEFKCFACEESDVSPDTLVPNKRLRTDAKNFQARITQKKRLAVTRGLPAVVVSQQLEDLTSIQTSKTAEVPTTKITNSTVPPTAAATSSSFSQSSSLSSDVSSSAPPPSVSPTPSSIPDTVEEDAVDSVIVPSRLKEVKEQDQQLPTSSTTVAAATVRSKSPVIVTNSSIHVPITKPISLTTSTSHLIAGPGSFAAPISMVTAPLISAVPHPLTLPAVPLQQPALFPQAATHSSLMPGLSLSVPVPQITTTLPVAPPKTHQSATNSLLLQAAALNSQTSSMDPASMARLTELLSAAADRGARPKSKSPPPLTLEEFYRQQKVLRGLNISASRSRSGSVSSCSSYDSGTSYSRSRSSTPRGRRSRSRSFTPDRYSGSRYHRYSKKSRRRDYSPDEWEETRSKSRRRNRSSERESRRALKSKRRPKTSEHSSSHIPSVSKREELGGSSKLHKKKKRKRNHSDREKLANDLPSPSEEHDTEEVMGVSDPSLSTTQDSASDSKVPASLGLLDSNADVNDPSQSKTASTDPLKVSTTVPDPLHSLATATDTVNPVEESSSSVCSPSATRVDNETKQLMEERGGSKMNEMVVNHLEDADVRSSPLVLPHPSEPDEETIVVRPTKKRKHKQKEREEREKRRHKKRRHDKEDHREKARRKKSKKRD